MVDQTETFTRHLVRALCGARVGKRFWFSLPKKKHDATKGAIALAVDRRWMLLEGHHNNFCLTDAGRDLVRHGRRIKEPAHHASAERGPQR
jgi:hypothetical protein